MAVNTGAKVLSQLGKQSTVVASASTWNRTRVDFPKTPENGQTKF